MSPGGGALRRAALALLAAAAVAAACQRPPPEGDEVPNAGLVERVAGCWELTAAAEGAEADTVRRWIEEGALPEAIRLDTARADTGNEDGRYRVAWSYIYSRKQRRPLAAWRTVGADSIRVETPGAMAGTMLRLAAGAEGLSGTASVFSDVVQLGQKPGTPSAPVEARRTECPG